MSLSRCLTSRSWLQDRAQSRSHMREACHRYPTVHAVFSWYHKSEHADLVALNIVFQFDTQIKNIVADIGSSLGESPRSGTGTVSWQLSVGVVSAHNCTFSYSFLLSLQLLLSTVQVQHIAVLFILLSIAFVATKDSHLKAQLTTV